MEIRIPEKARIIVIEGIAGSGKTTLMGCLGKQLQPRTIYEYSEQELMLGWKHIHIPHVSSIRIDFFNALLDELEEKMVATTDSVVILERFHLSMRILEWEFESRFNERYNGIVERLKRLPVYILIAELNRAQVRDRMHHRERSRQWREFVEEKLKLRGYENLEKLSVDQQRDFLNIATSQGIPFSTVQVDLQMV
jgi:thymidylate kinase